jgi:3-(3-hydroxy-phenyl)propionate hydroxylase
VRRLREIVRDGLTLLLTGPCDHERLARSARAAVRAPVTVLDLARIDVGGGLAGALRAAAGGEAWLIRPDAHIAAVLPAPVPEEVAAAVRRSAGFG